MSDARAEIDPAVIGPWMIERLLLKEVVATTAYIERQYAGVAH